MTKARISFKAGYGLCMEAIVQPWDQGEFDAVERRFLRLLPKRPLDQVHTDDLYFAGRFYFMAAMHSKQRRHYAQSKHYFAAAARRIGDVTKGTILDWRSWMLVASGNRAEKSCARATLWEIVKQANIQDAYDAAATIALISKSEAMKAKATAAALARYETICEDLRSDLRFYSDSVAVEQKVKSQQKQKRGKRERKK